jgi:hypothetical protein
MSGEMVPYHLRQNKHVDRQLFVELLSHVNRVTPIRDALYVSFGGVYFEDFKAIHQVFGTERMLSIEMEEWIVKRQRHNKPYGCIKCKQLTSGELVDNIESVRQRFGRRQMICWLDFADASKRRLQLEEISVLAKSARELDVLRITMNANPANLSTQTPGETIEARDEKRLEKLRADFADFIPREIEGADATKRGFPHFVRDLIKHQLQRSLSSRPGLLFQPLGSYSYADSEHTMVTVTGAFLAEGKVADYISKTKIQDFEFAGLSWELRHINVPLLSQREKLALDQKLRNGKKSARLAASLKLQVDKKRETSANMLKSYFDFHRYYPHFHRIHY